MMYTLLPLALLLLVLALSGAFTGIVKKIQDIKNMGKEETKKYVSEIIKDIYYKRSNFKLELSCFPEYMKNDISAYLTPLEFEQWKKRFGMISQRAEASGTTTTGLPYYSFILPNTSEECTGIYEEMIRAISENELTLGNCTETRVIIEWYLTNDTRYYNCQILYARTASEQVSFKRLAEYLDNRMLGITTVEIRDPELDQELSIGREGEQNG